MTLQHVLPALFGAALMAVAPTLVAAQEAANPASTTRPVSTRFKCQDGGELTARFAITARKCGRPHANSAAASTEASTTSAGRRL
jgi:hypothetical protein